MKHPWFANIDWKKCYKKQIKPYFIPDIKDKFGIDYFDEEFTSERKLFYKSLCYYLNSHERYNGPHKNASHQEGG